MVLSLLISRTESEYMEENRPGLGDIFGDAAEGAGGAFLDEVLAGVPWRHSRSD